MLEEVMTFDITSRAHQTILTVKCCQKGLQNVYQLRAGEVFLFKLA